jgi:hypothetical protein
MLGDSGLPLLTCQLLLLPLKKRHKISHKTKLSALSF